MEQTAQQNPLRHYFRTFKIWMKLPSGTSYYPPGSITFSEKGEVGIMPMTGKDELTLQNPDSLLNGEALIEVIASCVPAVKNPRQLLANDIDALITAIRYCTYNDNLETNLICPNCGHENSFKLDLQHALDQMEYLEPEYIAYLESGLEVYVKPYSFPEILEGLHMRFEQNKLTRIVESSTMTEEQKSAVFGSAFKEMSKITFALLTSSILKIVDTSKGITVTEKKFIQEFLYNIDKNNVEKISDLVKEINNIGIKRTFIAKCEKCEHQWESEIDFNPVNFS